VPSSTLGVEKEFQLLCRASLWYATAGDDDWEFQRNAGSLDGNATAASAPLPDIDAESPGGSSNTGIQVS
jgi:hypothetical protein